MGSFEGGAEVHHHIRDLLTEAIDGSAVTLRDKLTCNKPDGVTVSNKIQQQASPDSFSVQMSTAHVLAIGNQR